MCGIAGFIDFRGTSSLQDLEKMAATMPHRGPDGQGVYFDTFSDFQLGLGHRRLSIIDLSSKANQPMHFEHLSVVFNGEIYNFKEIQEELRGLGHQFVTESDTEVILHSWKEWGASSISKWRGMFAIVLFDKHANEIVCIRDRAGVKPLFYFFQNDLFLFGSELKSLLAHPRFSKRVDRSAVATYLQYGYISAPYCIFQDTFKLEAGHLMRISLASGKIQKEQYWNVYDYYNQPKLNISLPEAIEETERILKNSFDYRMVADVPVGVFLSGGYDSSCVTALLQKDATEKIKTFTIGAIDQQLDEAPFAKEIAARLGTDHTEYYCTSTEALDIIPDLPFYYDEPFADSSAIPTILVSRVAKEKVSVALSADAGDEIFAGYNRYAAVDNYGRWINKLPTSLRKFTASMMSAVSSEKIPILKNKPSFHSRYEKIRNFLENKNGNSVLKAITQVFSDPELERLFSMPYNNLATAHDRNELNPGYDDSITQMMAIDYQTYMVDDILQKVDRATMSASLEGREPFLDQHIVEWAAKLPIEHKFHNKVKKYILKEIVHQYLPKEIMDRPKSGFAIPVSEWLYEALKPLVLTYLSADDLGKHELFDQSEVQKLLDDFYKKGRKEKYLKVWHLLMFQMWYARWF